jgi:predicted transcriptional regulator
MKKPIETPRRFSIWARIEGEEKPGLLGRRFARFWPVHEHRKIDVRLLRSCGLEQGFEGLVVGLTADAKTGVLTGLMIRQQETARMSPPFEVPMERLLGLRDPIFHKLMLGTHSAIDTAIVRSLGRAAVEAESSRRISCLCALAKFVERRDVGINKVRTLLEELDAGKLADDPAFTQRVSVA